VSWRQNRRENADARLVADAGPFATLFARDDTHERALEERYERLPGDQAGAQGIAGPQRDLEAGQ
jgi:hypothetical protein